MNIQKNIPLAPLSTFQIGGEATSYIKVGSHQELSETVSYAESKGLEFKIFAGGSNVVFPDEGLDCLVIQIQGGKYTGNMRELVVEAGVDLSQVVFHSIEQGWKGLESLSGIPGTIGGAIVGNAGAYGHSISEVVGKVEMVEEVEKSREGSRGRWVGNEECKFSYRESVFKHNPYLILRAILKFEQGNKEELERISKEIIKKREVKYHPGIKCPGSFFKNVLIRDIDTKSLAKIDQSVVIDGKIPAGYLLSEVGARGMKEGGIEIADFHGNLFINKGNGTADDVKSLARFLKDKVREKFGIELEEEIRYF